MNYQRPTPTALELREGANHLLYEVQMLSNTAAILENGTKADEGWGWESRTTGMANLESFLIHARSLMDFVCPPSDWETRPVHERGIFAADYCSAPWMLNPWPTLREEHKQISREIEHLTFDRLPVGRNWKYGEMLRKLRGELLRFLDEADGLSGGIRDQVRAILVDGVRVSKADTTPGLAVSTATISALPTGGVSGATTSLIDPSRLKPEEGDR